LRPEPATRHSHGEKLKWEQTYTFPQLVSEMVSSDVAQMSAKARVLSQVDD
jgi:GDP-D-mannose dehydratase